MSRNPTVVLAVAITAACAVLAVAEQRLLLNSTGMYPRAVQLSDGTIVASVVTFVGNQGIGRILASTDGGASFVVLGGVTDPAGTTGLCCATLYELQAPIGTLKAGTLLWAGSFGQAVPRMSIRAWSSTDGGKSWSFLSEIVNTTSTRGLWEPEFSLTSTSGVLVCTFSDETQFPLHSQVLTRRTSKDGVNWSSSSNIVASADPMLRPGMANVRLLAPSLYIMSYEVCGTGVPAVECGVHLRTSSDGLNWGDPNDMGTFVKDGSGGYFLHTPVITSYGPFVPDGVRPLFLTAQMYMTANGEVAPRSGGMILSSQNGVDGPFEVLNAPVFLYVNVSSYCPNYSPALIVLSDERTIFEISTDYGPAQICEPWVGSGQL
jgi:hypothetical protein